MSRKTVVTIGGSFVGMNAAKDLAASLPPSHRVVLVEANSHFNFLFGFPRFAVLPNHHEEKCFIPYTHVFSKHPDKGRVVQATAVSVHSPRGGAGTATAPWSAGYVKLDRKIDLDDGRGPSDEVPFTHLVVATGTRLQTPWTMPGTEKRDGVATLQEAQRKVKDASKIVLVGGGAVGVQVAFDIKQLYPEKSVTLLHSREQLLNKFHHGLSDLVLQRFADQGIQTKLGSRVKIPEGGFPDFTPGKFYNVELANGETVETDLTMLCTGQTPRTSFLKSLSPASLDDSGFIRVRPTLQVASADAAAPPAVLDRIYAVGDVADSGAMKTVRSGMAHVPVVVANILAQIEHEAANCTFTPGPGGIHLTLGLHESVKFGNPPPGQPPRSMVAEDGEPGMHMDRVWDRIGVPREQRDYRL
ncbi:hypothetical protein DFJ73DRAFT_623213 [Zopfochytrium polystomum]|nr:hypothetical protein DFJ73DRAFT_623213 [Zopfochytrium polystomum]